VTDQVHAVATAMPGSVKNAEDAKSLLQSKGWIIAGKNISLETLARTLFALMLEPKIPLATINAVTAVASLLTEKLDISVKQEMADKLAEHIQETINSVVT